MGGLVYTAVVGGFEPPRKIAKQEEGIDFIRFTDAIPGSMMNDLEDRTPRAVARAIKVLTPVILPDYDWYLWLDGSMEVRAKLDGLIEKLLESKHDMAAFKHNERNCAYAEIRECIGLDKDRKKNLDDACRLLQEDKLPKNFGLPATGVLWRRGCDAMRKHALDWWSLMERSTLRDQCLIMLPLWRSRTYLEWIPGSHLKNMWFKYHLGHK